MDKFWELLQNFQCVTLKFHPLYHMLHFFFQSVRIIGLISLQKNYKTYLSLFLLWTQLSLNHLWIRGSFLSTGLERETRKKFFFFFGKRALLNMSPELVLRRCKGRPGKEPQKLWKEHCWGAKAWTPRTALPSSLDLPAEITRSLLSLTPCMDMVIHYPVMEPCWLISQLLPLRASIALLQLAQRGVRIKWIYICVYMKWFEPHLA